ncbi:MAG TPA: 4-hydroxybenzoate octaprenyltransferase [Archaeoglobaceae archaeon]|nr:4-hydroxybenzoate octaprenyltransferase [Archaeoglobaceae archaeon]
MERIKIYADFIKIEHTLFALPFAYTGAFLSAGGLFDIRLFILILTAFTGMRTLAMTLNRIIDRGIDALNPRTKNRHLPAGIISLKEAWSLAVISAAIYFSSAFLINTTAFILSPIPAITALIYPYLKRFTCLSHYILGLNLAYAPMGGWIAISNSFNPFGSELAITLLGVGVAFWVAGFDMIYGLQDYEFDRKYKLHSIGAHFGVKKALIASAIAHLFFFFLTSLSLYFIGFGMIVKVGLVAVAILLIYQHLTVGENYSERKIQVAFFNANAMISAILLLSIILDTLVRL